MSAVPETPPSLMVWKAFTYGWYGEMRAAFDAADIFDRFTEREYEALAHVAAERVASVQAKQCDAKYMPGPGRGSLQCERHLGHVGDHEASQSANSPSSD